MRALVTGAAGFIGSTLVDRLLADGYQVIGIDNLSTGVAANLEHALSYNALSPGRFTFVRADIQAPELVGIVAGANPSVIFHLAAHVDLMASVNDAGFDARTNVLGTINLCEASWRSGVRRIVYAASGGSRYGAAPCLPASENAELDPQSPYAVAKVAGELYLRAYAGMHDIAPINLALADVYGPRQNPHGEAGLITVLGREMLSGRAPIVYGDGSASRDYVYVDDVVDAFVRAGSAPIGTTGTFNIGTGECTTVNEIHRLVSALLDSSSSPIFTAPRVGEMDAIALDAAKAEKELGWKSLVGLPEGIQRTIRWLCENSGPQSAALARPRDWKIDVFDEHYANQRTNDQDDLGILIA